MAINVRLIDNSDTALSELEEKIEVGLEACGMMMETFAKGKCPVDTGRLRNSITHASNEPKSMSVGTNVEYGPYVEMGTSKMGARPFIEPSVSDHLSQYKQIIIKHLQSS